MRNKLHEIPDTIYDKQIRSTEVENVRQIRLFLQNKPNFSAFFTQKPRFHKKTNPIQTQFEPNSKPILGRYQGGKANSKPIVSKVKINAFSWIMNLTIIYSDLLAKFTTLKGANFIKLYWP
jgi:hypothetical protein